MILGKKNKIRALVKKGVALGGVLIMLLGCPMQAMAAEASICHKHIGSCYEKQPIHCQDDTEITTFNQEFNCATCGRVASARVVVETYSCKYMYLKRELRRIAYCYSCSSIVQHEEKAVSAIHTRMADVCVCGMEDSTVIAKVNFTANASGWTKDNVMLKASVTEPVSGQSLAPYTYTFSAGTANGNTCTVSANGTYSVTVTGNNGQQATASVSVTNIDKDAPKITKCYVDKEYPEYESANIVVEASDSHSGLAGKAYSFDGGKTYGTSNKFSITANGTYQIAVKDNVGNCSTQTLNVTCFEVKPEVKPEAKPDEKPEEKPSEDKDTTLGKDESQGNNGQPSQNVTKKEDTSKESLNVEVDKEHTQVITEKDENTMRQDEEYVLLKEKLENSVYKVPLEKIPGVYSSFMKYNAEKDAIPMTLNMVTKDVENAYSSNEVHRENLVKNITIPEEKNETDGSFAQVSKGIVAAGVLLCIGMVGFLIVFLVKKQ